MRPLSVRLRCRKWKRKFTSADSVSGNGNRSRYLEQEGIEHKRLGSCKLIGRPSGLFLAELQHGPTGDCHLFHSQEDGCLKSPLGLVT